MSVDNARFSAENYYQNRIESLLKENENHQKYLQHIADKADEKTVKESEEVSGADTNTAFNLQFDGEDHLILRSLFNTASRNILRKKPGYRHDDIMKVFTGYIKMISGALAYDTLHANLSLGWPSESSANNFIRSKGPECTEGQLRCEELFKYLNDRNLPLRVSLSEDATRIQATVCYNPSTNQLVGFAPPLDKNGIPVAMSFPARNAKEIQKHYANPSNIISSNAYVQMAQPQSRNIAPFCLLLWLTDNTFTAEKILSRWNHTTNELQKHGIKVDNFASDGDPRHLKVMKFKSQIGVNDLKFLNCEYYSCGSTYQTCTQDPTHVGTKARGLIIKPSRITPIGQTIISVTHLKYLIRTVSKDKHLLTAYVIEPKDKQNFDSVEKICAQKVISSLQQNVPGSERTALFLKALNYTLYSYLDSSMSSVERVYKSWYGLFFFRLWRSWLLQSKYTLKESFISSNCYLCIELNSHSLVKQILKIDETLGETDYGSYMLNPDLQGSQPCEALFRQARSFSSMYSNVSNFNMLQFTNRINKIQLQSEIIHQYSGKIKFPRFDKKRKNTPEQVQSSIMLRKDEIIAQIEKAKSDITKDFEGLAIDTIKLDFRCQIKPTVFQNEFYYDDDIDDDDSDDDDTNNDENISEESPEENIPSDDEESVENDNILEEVTGELEMRDHSKSGLEVDENGPLALVADSTGKEKVVHKGGICWYLNKDRCKLSSDRLKRVMEKDFQKTPQDDCHLLANNNFEIKEDISVGDWGAFEVDGRLLIGLILSFCYVNGKTFRDRKYTKLSAFVKSEKAIGVLASWYTWNIKGHLISYDVEQHKFISISCYLGTFRSPSYVSNTLQISSALKDILNEMAEEIMNK